MQGTAGGDRAATADINNPTDLSRGIYLASIDAEDRSLRRYAGQTMFNTEGAELGAVQNRPMLHHDEFMRAVDPDGRTVIAYADPDRPRS